MTTAVAILAAGKGTRMRSSLPKVLHELAGRPLIDHVVDLALTVAAPADVVVVVGHGAEAVRTHLAGRGVRTVVQEPQLGTGDALRVALGGLPTPAPSDLLVLSGDVPLLTADTIAALDAALAAGAEAALLTAELDEPGGYGRVVRDGAGRPTAVVEARDADPATLAVHEVNAGVYAFRTRFLAELLRGLGRDNDQGEMYLTDLVATMHGRGLALEAVRLADPREMAGVNTRADLAAVARWLNERIVAGLMAAGVTVLDPATTWVEPGCAVGADAVLEAGVILRGGASVGAGARVGAHTVLDGARVAEGEVVPPLTRR